MSYVIVGLDPAQFRHLYGMSDAELAATGAARMAAPDAELGFPCRVTLKDVRAGDTVLVLNYMHQPAANAFRSSHAIFVREGAEVPARFEGRVPEQFAARLLSVRAFDRDDMMIDADVVDGKMVEGEIERMLAEPETAYLHVHFARRGCFAGRVDRA